MFCQTCGTELTKDFSFCPRCGANQQPSKNQQAIAARAELLNIFLFTITLSGLGIALGFIAVMKEFGFDNSLIILIVLLSFLIILGVDAVFIWQLFNIRRDAKQTQNETAPFTRNETKPLDEAKTPLLNPIPASVTEKTTNLLETVVEEREKIRR